MATLLAFLATSLSGPPAWAETVNCTGGGSFGITGNVITQSSGCVDAVIPNTVTSIAYEAFASLIGPSSLTSVTFQAGSVLASIGDSAFRGTSLTPISIPKSVTSIGDSAFQDATST